MGLLDKLFKRSPKDSSLVRSWVLQRMKENRIANAQTVTLELLFLSLTYGLIKFFYEDRKSLFKGKGKPPYNDAILFEVGCYSVFRIDLWLYSNSRKLREEIVEYFHAIFIALFEKSLYNSDVCNLLEKRLQQYEAVITKKEGLEGCHYHLEQLILRAKDGKPCNEYSFDKSPIVLADIFEAMDAKTSVVGWEGYLDVTLKDVERYCKQKESK